MTVLNGFRKSPNGAFTKSNLGARGKKYNLLIAGRFTLAGAVTMRRVAIYNQKDGTLVEPGGGISGGIVYASARWGSLIVLVGTFDLGSGRKGIMTFNPGTGVFSALGSGMSAGATDKITTVIVVGDDIYIAGLFDTIDGVACKSSAKYTASTGTWGPYIDIDSGGTRGQGSCLLNVANEIYMVGDWDNANGSAINAKVKNGGVWGNSTGPSTTGYISSVVEYAGNVYALGNYLKMDGAVPTLNNLSYYSGGWPQMGATPFGSSQPFTLHASRTAAVYNGKLYLPTTAGQSFGNVVMTNSVGTWDGSVFANFSGSSPFSNGGGQTMFVSNNRLYFGGRYWDGTSMQTLAGFNDTVFTFCELP